MVSQSDILAKSLPTVAAPVPGQCDLHHCNSNRFKQLSIMRGIVKTQWLQCSQPGGWKEHIKKFCACHEKIFHVQQRHRKTRPVRKGEKDGPLPGRHAGIRRLRGCGGAARAATKKLPLPIAAVNGRYQRICPNGQILLACLRLFCRGLLPKEKMPQSHTAMPHGIGHQKPYKNAVQACRGVRHIAHLP